MYGLEYSYIYKSKGNREVTFQDYYNEQQALNEKLIVFNGGKRTGQVVFMAGAGGSGKGFVQSQFMDVRDFKVFDVDQVKTLALKVSKLGKYYREIRNLDLTDAENTRRLHVYLRTKLNKHERNIHQEKWIRFVLSTIEKDFKGLALPNIMFDKTLSNLNDLTDVIPELLDLGYQRKDIHISWVLTDSKVALHRNQTRARRVPDDVMRDAHRDVAKTIYDMIFNGTYPRSIDGEFNVVLNNSDQTQIRKSDRGGSQITDFTYYRIKKSGKKFISDQNILNDIQRWVADNTPKG